LVFIYDLQFLAVQLEVCAEGEAATFAENDHLGLFGVNNEVISHRVSSQPPEEEVELHRGGRKECKVVRVQETVDVGGVRETDSLQIGERSTQEIVDVVHEEGEEQGTKGVSLEDTIVDWDWGGVSVGKANTGSSCTVERSYRV
jgi:hypothetical protein